MVNTTSSVRCYLCFHLKTMYQGFGVTGNVIQLFLKAFVQPDLVLVVTCSDGNVTVPQSVWGSDHMQVSKRRAQIICTTMQLRM